MRLIHISIVATFLIPIKSKVPIGAVVTNGPKCANIGTSILTKGGTAVEAAIAVLFCEGVSIPNCMGIGGGFLMNIYIKDKGISDFLISRELAPKNANKDMFRHNENLAKRGGLAVAVPGEVKGYWEAYKKYGGKILWKELIQPTIDLCNKGILVTDYLERVFRDQKDVIINDPILKETFIDLNTNKTYVKGQIIKRPRLVKTLQLIAEQGADALYNSSLTKDFVEDIRDKGGIITEEDLHSYQPLWTESIKVQLPFNQILYAPPLPSSGVILSLILNILNGFLDYSRPSSTVNWQRIIESFKFGFGKRTELGDSNSVNMTKIINKLISTNFSNEIRNSIFDNLTFQDAEHYGAKVMQSDDHGTANVCVFAPNGDAVVVTSTINLDFGAGFMSNSTGIILNNEMDDFSSPNFINNFGVPPSSNNFIEPGKRPISSMVPTIVVEADGNVRLVVGGSGGTKIITSVALTMIKNLWFNITIKNAVADKRLHHQLFPMQINLEKEYQQDLDFVKALQDIGHVVVISNLTGFNTVTAISIENNNLFAAFDPRRGGAESYVYKN